MDGTGGLFLQTPGTFFGGAADLKAGCVGGALIFLGVRG